MKLAPILLLLTSVAAAQVAAKPKVAVFPLGGSSNSDLRDRVGFSIRAKLDRDGAYDPIDGPAMIDLAASSPLPITFDSPVNSVTNLAQGSDAVVLVWGDLSPGNGGDVLRLHTLDLRNKPPQAKTYQAAIADPQQVRFVVEKFLATLPGVAAFTHPDEQAVHHDPVSDALFARNPNLVPDAEFSPSGRWTGIFQADKYPLAISNSPPLQNSMNIYHTPDGNGVAMNMTLRISQTYGLAALSDPFPIEPGVRYRISFRYRSDGPSQQSFVKGYVDGKSLSGAPEDMEVYRLQLPPTGATGGQWKTVESDLDPFNPSVQVKRLRVDFYGYMNAGLIVFDRVQVKAVGRQGGAAPATAPSPIR